MDRPLYHPPVEEQITALYILLASPLPSELRRLLRQREIELSTQRKAA